MRSARRLVAHFAARVFVVSYSPRSLYIGEKNTFKWQQIGPPKRGEATELPAIDLSKVSCCLPATTLSISLPVALTNAQSLVHVILGTLRLSLLSNTVTLILLCHFNSNLVFSKLLLSLCCDEDEFKLRSQFPHRVSSSHVRIHVSRYRPKSAD